MRTAIDYALEAKDLREKLREVRADRDALRAALAQQLLEPCAYRLRDEEASTHYGRDMYVFFAANEFLSNERAEAVKTILEPLYAAPAAQQVPEPTPAMCRAAVEYVNGPDVYSKVPREALAIEEGIYASVWRAMKAVAPPAAQQVPAVPEGWKLAPAVPTPEMSDFRTTGIHWQICERIYIAMLAAAPLPTPADNAEVTGLGRNRSKDD